MSACDHPILPVLAVVVLYKMRPSDSVGFQTLQTAISALGEDGRQVRVLLYDNSPVSHEIESLPGNTLYYTSGRNEGIAGSNNAALKLALNEGCQWLLTLDQDTVLPQDFLLRILAIAVRSEKVDEIGAIVPQLTLGSRLLSPTRIRPWRASYLPRGFVGFMPGEIRAFNSASLFRVSALKQIGGFSLEFWLDYQDIYVYHMLHRIGKKVYIAGDIQVEHDLSVVSQRGSLNPTRYRNLLQAESAFHDLYAGNLSRLLLSGRLLGRSYRQWNRGESPEVRRMTWAALARRVFRSRAERIREWREDARRLFPPAQMADGQTFPERKPAVSVCMATYNGERFVVEQLQSILNQLTQEDEVVIVDDASTDDTVTKIKSLDDSRIRLLRNEENAGVQATFERAIRASSGEILFLSDQDDIWAPQKVERILEAFRSHPDVMLVVTDSTLIDENGTPTSSSYFAGRGKFHSGLWVNLVRNRFLGCAMTFRAELLSDILPFPQQREVLHDIWIGIRTSLSGHRTLYIDEPLVLYRRHPATVTGRRTLSLKRKLALRISLILALTEFWIGKHGADISDGSIMATAIAETRQR